MQEAESKAEQECDWGVPGPFSEADAQVAEAQAKVESYAVESTDEQETVDADVEEKDLVEDGEVRRPGGFKPAQLDGEAQGGEREEIAPVAAYGRVGGGGLME